MFLVLAATAVFLECQAHAAPPAVAGVLEVAARPVTLRTGIGSAHDDVSTSVKQAQAFYDQGLAYLHSFVWLEAARSFNQALRLDPNLAIAHAQLSLVYTELNAPAAAREALAHATALAPKASEHDRRHIGLRALQLAAEQSASDPSKLTAYREALDEALAKRPADAQFWLMRGMAESTDPAERGQGSVAEAARFYQKALAHAPGEFAAHHYLAHAYENAGRAQDALVAAATYAKMAPGVPHARHMHGHDLRRAGQIEEAIAEFVTADTLENDYFRTERVPPEYDWHYQHNLDLLATSYQYVGQMRKAETLLKASFAIPSQLVEQEFNKREWPVFLLARGRAADALAAATVMAAHRSAIVSATGHVYAGLAKLALGQYQGATEEANAALRLMRGAPLGAGIVAAPLKALQGEFFLRTGQKDKGRQMLEDVIRTVRATAGPDAWTQALFTIEAVARAARDAGDWHFAAWAARQMREHDPHYAGSHMALALVAEQRGDRAMVTSELDLAARYWKNADQDLPEWKMIRGRKDD